MNPLQRAAVRRKASYIAAILVLFTISIFYRGLEAKTPEGRAYVWMPFGRDDRETAPSAIAGAGDSLSRRTILSQSKRLELRELDDGETEVAGEAVRLGLVGSRGLAVTFLWYSAIQKQKRNDFHEFERLVQAVTALQPHFITPWIFQSWNIAYNVSVEMQSLGDMYFYIARGIDLLAEGERRNRRSPDMRYEIGTYYQTKFGVTDQVQTLRCLFQLSCIPPDQRNPAALENPDGSVNREAFLKFCQDHPMLVRRLRGEERRDEARDKRGTSEMLRTRRPEDVIQFLRDNQNVPSRYKNATELKPAEQQFPSLPRQFPEGEGEAHPRASADDLTQAFSGYLAARAWFAYANTLLPPNPKDAEGNAIPISAPTEFDPFKYRIPRRPIVILFRQGAPRAQHYQAEMLQKDGWIDTDGWEVDAGIDESNAWFVDTVGGVRRKPQNPVVVGAGTSWSLREWQKAYSMWVNHGNAYGLSVSPARMERYRRAAGLGPNDQPSPPPPLSPDQRLNPKAVERHDALSALWLYNSNRSLTNFPFYYAMAEGEQQKQTVEARKILWRADQARRVGNHVQAAELYERGFQLWRGVLARNPKFHRPEQLNKIEEDTFTYELDYVRMLATADPKNQVWRLAKDEYAADYRRAAAALPLGAFAPVPSEIPESLRDSRYAATAERHFSPFAGNIKPEEVDPGDPRVGTPWIPEYIKSTILQQQGIVAPPPPPPPANAAGPGSSPGG
ncbi:MAG: hypothetical protein U0791_19100 [Gemmataceae bacterium]